jgi:hypothetical protein
MPASLVEARWPEIISCWLMQHLIIVEEFYEFDSSRKRQNSKAVLRPSLSAAVFLYKPVNRRLRFGANIASL